MHKLRDPGATRHRRSVAAMLAIVLLLGLTATAAAHEKGTLKLASKSFRAGDSLAVSGSKFTAKDEITLFLVGVSGRHALGDIPTDTAGGFKRVVLIPASAAAGQYRMVAEALDGDEVASLDVVVLAAAAAAGAPTPGMADMPGMPGMAGHEDMQMAPSGEPLSLTRARSPLATATAIALIVALALAGAALLRRPHTDSRENRS